MIFDRLTFTFMFRQSFYLVHYMYTDGAYDVYIDFNGGRSKRIMRTSDYPTPAVALDLLESYNMERNFP